MPFNALRDPDFRRAVGEGLRDAGNRGVGNLLGAPVDASTGVLNAGIMAGGYLGNKLGLLSADQMPEPITDPVGGGEWFGQRMHDAGMVSGNRNLLAEGLASFAMPGGVFGGARGASHLADTLPPMAPSSGGVNLLRDQVGAISPEGKARLLADLQSGQSSGRYRLGDVTEVQGKGLDALFGRPAPARDVHMTDDAFGHIVDGRMGFDNFTPEQVAKFAEQAMAKRALPDLNVAKGRQHPSLLNQGLLHQGSGRTYNARMPFKQVNDGYELRTVYPENLRRGSNKAPKR